MPVPGSRGSGVRGSGFGVRGSGFGVIPMPYATTDCRSVVPPRDPYTIGTTDLRCAPINRGTRSEGRRRARMAHPIVGLCGRPVGRWGCLRCHDPPQAGRAGCKQQVDAGSLSIARRSVSFLTTHCSQSPLPTSASLRPVVAQVTGFHSTRLTMRSLQGRPWHRLPFTKSRNPALLRDLRASVSFRSGRERDHLAMPAHRHHAPTHSRYRSPIHRPMSTWRQRIEQNGNVAWS